MRLLLVALLVVIPRCAQFVTIPKGCSSYAYVANHRLPIIGRDVDDLKRFLYPTIHIPPIHGLNLSGIHFPTMNFTGLWINIKKSIYTSIPSHVPGTKELHSTCRIDVSKASSSEWDFLRALKDRYQLCMMCNGVSDGECHTVGVCSKGSYCYKGYDPDHRSTSTVISDPYLKPAGRTYGCCDPKHSHCHTRTQHGLTAGAPYTYFKYNYTTSTCSAAFCNAYTYTQYLSYHSKLFDGHWSTWTHWSSCSKSCGATGTSARHRTCNDPAPSGGGATCSGSSSEHKSCHTYCPVDGKWGVWSHWGSCSVTCGKTGHRIRSRHCTAPLYGGKPCSGSGTETGTCLVHCPINGHWASWGHWSSCSYSCGRTGHRTKQRTCTNPAPQYGGANCSTSLHGSTYTSTCHTYCPVDGLWASWGHWSACSISCGATGHKTRTRTCSNPAPAHGGKTCPVSSSSSPTSTTSCNIHCPVNGGWTSWGHWSSCSESCGKTGHKTRHRTCSHPTPAYGGQNCNGSTSSSTMCHSYCPVDGHWSHWSSYGSCSVSCCTGNQTRSRTCDNPAPAHGGKHCPLSSTSTRTCINSCKGDAEWAGWGHWTGCSAICGGGTKTRTRTCTNQTACTGPCIGSSKESHTCGTTPCVLDGHWGHWSSYGACSVSCCTGNRTRTRTCDHPAPAHGGKTCQGSSKSTITCVNSCKGDAKWSGWGHWTGCTATCDGGTKTRTRTCTNQTACTGSCPGSSKGSHACATNPCPIDGQWSRWSSYGACSVSCCTGNQTRTRTCDHPAPAHGGKHCPDSSTSTRTCTNSCKGDATWTGWGHWTVCTATCGGGTKTRARTCTNETACTDPCPGSSKESHACGTAICPVDGNWGHWSAYGACSTSCCDGHVTRTRQCNHPEPRYGGLACVGSSSQSKTCSNPCKGDATWNAWGAWSGCSTTCAASTMTRSRTCSGQSTCTGPCAGNNTDTAQCDLGACPVNGSWGHWSSYSACSVTCCSGDKTRTRLCNHPAPSHGGVTCPGLAKQSHKCSNPCKGDASWSSWVAWSACSVSCATGTKSRTRTCDHQSACTGPCPGNATEATTCDEGACPVWSAWFYGPCSVTCGTGSKQGIRRCSSGTDHDCSGESFTQETCDAGPCVVDGGWGDWQSWSSCSATCGNGVMTKTRTCNNPSPAYGGASCHGNNTMTEKCHLKACPIDGGWGQWTAYSACSVTCCQGNETRTRSCDSPKPAHGGSTCPGVAKETKSCTNPCEGDAIWTSWQTWGTCSESCGPGTQTRSRACHLQSACTGPCPGNTTELKACDLGICPDWSPWFFGACSVTCGPGTKQGFRRCSSGHEEDCTGPAMETEACNETPCPVDGGWGSWQTWSACSKTCGEGSRTRLRLCDSPAPTHGGDSCHGDDKEFDDCKDTDCPHWGPYYEVGSCSVTCGQGSVQLQRDCSTGNNDDCTGSPYDEKACTMAPC